jgi:carboxyl-terminal processing protease
MTIRGGAAVTAATSGVKVWSQPIAVLVDERTASMGEIVAAAFHEEAGATLLGGKTAGMVAVSVILPLTDGSGVQVTVQRLDSATGMVINNVGLSPDVAVSDTPSDSTATDPVLDLALRQMQQRFTK